MKTYLGILAIVVLSFASCKSPEGVTSGKYDDDVYYSSKDAASDREKQRIADEKQRAEDARAEEEAQRTAQNSKRNDQATDDYYKTSEKRTDANGNTYVTNNYTDKAFDYDDYYDYEYATKLRRFHNNCGSYGYYDNYYTNSYWYNNDPYCYGTSVYMGYNFWGPSYSTYSYNPSYYWYSNNGWGYDPWYHPYGYNPYAYNPYGGGYYGYNPYMNGYMNGYSNGYYAGYNNGYWNNNYFNSYDNNSYYYGPRRTMTSNSRTNTQPTMASRYMETVEAETHKPFEDTKGRDGNPYMKPTTVADYMSRPASEDRPIHIDSRPSNTNNSTNDYYQRPSNSERPRDNNYENRPQERPTYERERPRERPTYETPRENNSNQRSSPTYSSPRSSGGGSSGGSGGGSRSSGGSSSGSGRKR